ncbi:MAG: nucleotide exchange factor GrpE [Candidatus Caldatribacteriota bacterium]|nr:nucleotide exchange factor GrpE [Candidatus Caldatribacteriota bacterium]
MFNKKGKKEIKSKKEKPFEKKYKMAKKEELIKMLEKEDKNIVILEKKLLDAEKNAKEKDKLSKENSEKLLRLHADFDNYKKRQEKKQKEFIEYANEGLLNNLLSVLDNLERALDSTKKEENTKSIRQGLQNILKEFNGLLKKEGVRPIKSINQKFDPSKHEAVMKEETDKDFEDRVTEEFRKGYFIRSKVLRPAMVKVAVSVKEKK